MLAPAFSGFVLGLSLIVAIGAQNAFVLRQGLVRRHVFAVSLVCALSDAVLITVGVAGLGTLIASDDALLVAVTLGGALFLLAYALFAFRRAWQGTGGLRAEGQSGSLSAALATALALTWLNPHVYLDTVLLLGSLSAPFERTGRVLYGAGAVTASFAWFFALGYGARLLEPLFLRPAAWRVLDAAIGVVMLAIAGGLAWPLVRQASPPLG